MSSRKLSCSTKSRSRKSLSGVVQRSRRKTTPRFGLRNRAPSVWLCGPGTHHAGAKWGRGEIIAAV